MNGTIIAGGGRGLTFAHMISVSKEIKKANVNVKALVDINTSIHKKLKDSLCRYGLNETEVMSSFEEALEKFGPEVAQSVFIATPNTTHAKLTKLALQNNRHVFLEKPIAANWNDAADIVKAAQNSKQIIYMGLLLRCSRYYSWIHEIANSGILGNLVLIQMNERLDLDHSSAYRRGWRRLKANSGGLLNEKCSHDIDIMCWLKKAQSEPVGVFSYGGGEMFPDKKTPSDKCSTCSDKSCPFRRHNLEELNNQEYVHSLDLNMQDTCIFKTDANVHTYQNLNVFFSDGTQGIFSITLYSGDPDRDIIIHGTEGYLAGSLNSGKFKVNIYRNNKTMIYDTSIVNDPKGGANSIVSGFFETIINKEKPLADVVEAATASRIAFAADLSVAEARKVALSEFPYF